MYELEIVFHVIKRVSVVVGFEQTTEAGGDGGGLNRCILKQRTASLSKDGAKVLLFVGTDWEKIPNFVRILSE